MLTDCYGVFIRQDNSGKRLDVMTMRRNRNAPDTSRQWPRGSVAINRPVQDQCRDIVRRVIRDPQLQMCVDEAKLRADQQAEADLLKTEAFAVLEAAGAKRSPNHAESFHQGPGQGYYQGRVEYSGRVTFARLGSVSPERAARIIAILAEEETC